MNTVTKAEIAKKVANEIGETQVLVNKVIDSLNSAIMQELVSGNKVIFKGFGKYEPKGRASRIGRNPQTNEEIVIPATYVAKFTASKEFASLLMPEGEN